jgi:hypothetical protein
MGRFCYLRCPMGWSVSPQSVREFMMRILYKFKDNCQRYLNEIIIYHDTKEEFFKILNGILKTLDFHDFRIKGSKVVIGATSIKLLGNVSPMVGF